MKARTVATIAAKEMRDALHNKWFLLDAAAFLLLALGMSWLGLASDGLTGLAGFGRTCAALIDLVLLIVPLMGLTVGAMSLAGERERGTMATLLGQPMTRLELFAGKWCGLATALAACLLVGFGVPGMMVALAGSRQNAGSYLAMTALALLVGLAALALGMLISAATRSTAVAIGLAIGLWLLLVFFGDLGLLGAGLAMNLDAGQLLSLALVNPLTDFRIAAIASSGASPETLGPAGQMLSSDLGGWLVPSLAALLALWSGLPLVAGYAVLRRGDLS